MGDFDLQVNGYGGIDFNRDDLTLEQLRRACDRLIDDGVEGVLATLITEDLPVLCRRLGRLAELREQDPRCAEVIRGFHVEGPFLSPEAGYRGAHPAEVMISATADAADRLLDAGRGRVRLLTLAPERDPGGRTTRHLADRGVVVSAGHTNATRDELAAAIDQGLSMFTHLGNGCPMQMHRHDNIIQRALSFSDRLWLCFIADGVHVPFFALDHYIRLAGLERCIVVTDAIAPAGLGPGRYTVSRWELEIGEDLVAQAADGSHLVGSAISMPRVRRNLEERLGYRAAEIATLVRDNPRKAVGLTGVEESENRRTT
jgi:N-acetylglucosamine-6-phosphate deacetylase